MKQKQIVKFAIGIPTINQWPLLKPYVGLYLGDFPKTPIIIVDNGNQDITFPGQYLVPINVLTQTSNLGVPASWNLICRTIFGNGFTHAIIPNDDIYWGRKGEELQTILEKYPRDLYKTSRDDFSLFVLPKTTFEKIGPFNEMFYPGYFEDRDYMYRMKLAGCSVMSSLKFDAMLFKESQSSQKDPSLLERFDINEELYIKMWGGKPGFEKYTKPFNGKPPIFNQPADGG